MSAVGDFLHGRASSDIHSYAALFLYYMIEAMWTSIPIPSGARYDLPISFTTKTKDYDILEAPGITLLRMVLTLVLDVAVGMAHVEEIFVAIFINIDGQREGPISQNFFAVDDEGKDDAEGNGDGAADGAGGGERSGRLHEGPSESNGWKSIFGKVRDLAGAVTAL